MVNLEKNKNYENIIIISLLSIFCISKLVRGSSNSENIGGIWNIISLFFYFFFFIDFLRNSRKKINFVFVFPFLYSFISMIFVLITSKINYNVSFMYNYLMIPIFFIVFYIFYYNSDDKKNSNRLLIWLYVVCLIMNLISFFNTKINNNFNTMSSDVYYTLGLFPFVLILLKNKFQLKILTLLQFIVLFLADKRTGIIAFLLGGFAYILINLIINRKKKFSKIFFNFILILFNIFIILYITLYLDNKFDLGIYNRFFNIIEDQGSDRLMIYKKIISDFKTSSLFEKIFGHGYNSIYYLTGYTHAHNDFLEIIYVYGIFPFLFIIMFYLILIINLIKMIKKRSIYAAPFCFSLITSLFLSLFSYFIIFYTYIICYSAVWGFILKLDKKKVINNEYN